MYYSKRNCSFIYINTHFYGDYAGFKFMKCWYNTCTARKVKVFIL